VAKRTTHIIFGIGLAAFLIEGEELIELLPAIFSAFLGTILPDLDLRVLHRSLLHNIFVLGITTIALHIMVITTTYSSFTSNITLSYSIAYASHILLDLLTGGVTPFYPLHKKKLCIISVGYDDFIVNSIMTVIGLTLIFLKIHH